MSQPLPPKKEVALALLEQSNVHVHLDPRLGSVVVPPGFKNQPRLVLQIGLNMPMPIPDLHLDDEGMSCTLSFNRTPFHCVVPWASVFAMVGDDGRGMVWPDDIPPEVQAHAGLQQQRPHVAAAPPAPAEAPAAPARPKRASRKADDSRADETATAKKRTRKKPTIVPAPTEGRGRLVALPPPVAAARPRTNDDRPAARPKAKRELPPYLRVVK